jgi:hypothetical protein
VRRNVIPQPSVAFIHLGGTLVVPLVGRLLGQFGTEHGVNCGPIRNLTRHPSAIPL